MFTILVKYVIIKNHIPFISRFFAGNGKKIEKYNIQGVSAR